MQIFNFKFSIFNYFLYLCTRFYPYLVANELF